MDFTKIKTIYIVQINYKEMSDVNRISRFRYDSLEKAENAIRHFKKELGRLISRITIIKEELDIL